MTTVPLATPTVLGAQEHVPITSIGRGGTSGVSLAEI